MEKKLVQRSETEVDGDACKASYLIQIKLKESQESKQIKEEMKKKTNVLSAVSLSILMNFFNKVFQVI